MAIVSGSQLIRPDKIQPPVLIFVWHPFGMHFVLLNLWPPPPLLSFILKRLYLVILKDCSENAEEVPRTFLRGFWEGVWWGFITTSTVGWVVVIYNQWPALYLTLHQEKIRGQRGSLPAQALGYVKFGKVIFRRPFEAEVCFPDVCIKATSIWRLKNHSKFCL